jgi:F-type H+-transporting ATPase subunit delta
LAQRSTSALRYAEAIFQVARDHGSYDTWLRELGEVEQLLTDPLAAQVLLSPVVPRDRKSAILDQALSGLSPQTHNFIDLLVRRERLELIPQVNAALRELIDAARGFEVARVTTAAPLSDEERGLVVARLAARTGKRIRIEEQVDPSIMGGVVAQVGDEIIDGSVRGRLESLRRALAGPI